MSEVGKAGNGRSTYSVLAAECWRRLLDGKRGCAVLMLGVEHGVGISGNQLLVTVLHSVLGTGMRTGVYIGAHPQLLVVQHWRELIEHDFPSSSLRKLCRCIRLDIYFVVCVLICLMLMCCPVLCLKSFPACQ
jgi:hypothetical protein